MKKRIALTLTACIAFVAVIFMYKNDKTNQRVTTENGTTSLVPDPSVKMPNITDNQALTLSLNNTTPSKDLQFSAKITTDTRLSAIETERENEAEEDEAPLINGHRISKQERINEAIALEIERTKDPALGYVPQERMIKATEKTRRLQAEFQQQKDFLRGSIANARWNERGPGNVGGRTRAILVDRNDPTGKTVFVGSSLGGLFKNTDITNGAQRWERINDWLSNLTISSIAQDPRAP